MSYSTAGLAPTGILVQPTGPFLQSGNVFLLRFSNFRRIENLSVTIPENGIILLDGQTGIGKTTLLEAISFVLYDNAGNTCYNRKDRSSKKKHDPTWVELTLPYASSSTGRMRFPPGLVIYRQRRPTLLRVIGEGIALEDGKNPGPAQGFLDRLFGPYSTWRVGGYIRQESVCEFFTMSPSDKLNLLQQLSLPDRFDPVTGRIISGPEQFETLLMRTVEKIITVTEQVREAEMQTKISTEMYMRLYNQCAASLQGKTAWTADDLQLHFSRYNEVYSEGNLSQDLVRLLSKVRSATVSRSQVLQSQISEEQMRIARMREGLKQRRQLEITKNHLLKELEILPDVKEEIAALERSVSEIIEQIALAQRSERRSQLLAAKAEIQRRLDLIPNESSKYTLQELDSFDRLLSGLTPEQSDEQIKEANLTKEYLAKLALYNRRQAMVTQITGLESQLAAYPMASLSEEIEAIGKKIWSLSLQEKKLVCPKCSSALYLNGGQLTEMTQSELPQGNLLELNRQKTDYQRQESMFQQRGHLDRQLVQLKSELASFDGAHDLSSFSPQSKPRLTHLNPHQLETLIGELQRTKTLWMQVPTGINTSDERRKISSAQERTRLNRDIESISKEIEMVPVSGSPAEVHSLENRRREASNRIHQLRQQEIKRSTLQGQIEQLNTQILNLRSGRSSPGVSDEEEEEPDESVLEALKKELDILTSESQALEVAIGAQIQFSQLGDLMRQHSKCEQIYRQLYQRQAALYRIKATLITAEYIILDTFLSHINQSLAEVIEPMFSEPISISLRSLRQLKTDDRIKPQINYEIVIGGAECSNINELSGGERSRISLALAIVFSSFNNAPFLLLDESLSTLNASIKEATMKVIRHYLGEKLVIAVNHDTTTGVYDSVIRLG